MKQLNPRRNYYSDNLIRFTLLVYWSLYWLFNVLDKLIGGSHFLWVGKDRFAQFQRFFASAGWASPAVADVALVITAGLEVFAFLFFTGAMIHLLQKKSDISRTWFDTGIGFTLAIFTFFSVGDQLFGDRAELLEHTLFWILTLFTWGIFIYSDKFIPVENIVIPKAQLVLSVIVLTLVAFFTINSIFTYRKNSFHERTDGVRAEVAGNNLYKFSFPFLAGSKSFENSLKSFRREYPDKKIIEVYTVPDELRKQKADGLIVYITTANKK